MQVDVGNGNLATSWQKEAHVKRQVHGNGKISKTYAVIKDLCNASLMRATTDYYEVLETAEQTKVAGGSDWEQQCRLGLLQKAWGADGLTPRQKEWSGWRGGREGGGDPSRGAGSRSNGEVAE